MRRTGTQPVFNRRKALKVMATLPAGALLAGGSTVAETGGGGRGRKTAPGGMAGLLKDLAEFERNAVESSYPDLWQVLRYISVIEWSAGVFLCIGVSPPETSQTMFDAAMSRVESSPDCRFLGSDWSDDHRVWTMLVEGPRGNSRSPELCGPVAQLMAAIAPDVDAYQLELYLQDDPAGLLVKQVPASAAPPPGRPADVAASGRARP